jgi:hypothetical protein
VAGHLRKLPMPQALAEPCQTLSRLPASHLSGLGGTNIYRNRLVQQKFIDFYEIRKSV